MRYCSACRTECDGEKCAVCGQETQAVRASFRGEITGEAAGCVKKYLHRMNLLVYSLLAGAGFIIFLAVLLCVDPFFWFLSFSVVPLPLIALLPISKYGFSCYPSEVVVYEDVVCVTNARTKRTTDRKCEDADGVTDMGDYYLIRYSRFVQYVCVKANLQEGSLEAFEEVFREKIK